MRCGTWLGRSHGTCGTWRLPPRHRPVSWSREEVPSVGRRSSVWRSPDQPALGSRGLWRQHVRTEAEIRSELGPWIVKNLSHIWAELLNNAIIMMGHHKGPKQTDFLQRIFSTFIILWVTSECQWKLWSRKVNQDKSERGQSSNEHQLAQWGLLRCWRLKKSLEEAKWFSGAKQDNFSRMNTFAIAFLLLWPLQLTGEGQNHIARRKFIISSEYDWLTLSNWFFDVAYHSSYRVYANAESNSLS